MGLDWNRWALLAARWLIAALFLSGAAQKAVAPGAAEALLAMRGWPLWLVWPALAFNLCAGLALVVGWRVAPVAVLLAVYTGVTSLFHFQPEDGWQMSIFVKNWAIVGGCLALAVAVRGSRSGH